MIARFVSVLSFILLAPISALADGDPGTAFEVAASPSEILSGGEQTALYAYAGLGILLMVVLLVLGGRLSAKGDARLDEIDAELSKGGEGE